MDKPLTTTEKMDETGMDELCSALAALNRHGLRITGRLDAMATLDRHGLRISGHFHAMDIIQVGHCITALESRLAEVERERDSARETNAAMDRGIEAIAVALGTTDAELGFDHDVLLNKAKDLRARLARIEAAAREVARGDDDECHVCLEWGHCPRCTGNRETANRAKCDRCELRAALDLPVVVRTCCYRCRQWSEVRARFDDDHRREWLCASCRAALEGGG